MKKLVLCTIALAVMAIVPIGTLGATITEIIDASGDGTGNTLEVVYNVAVGKTGTIYVTGTGSDSAFKIGGTTIPSSTSTTATVTTTTTILPPPPDPRAAAL